jgi:colanic acid/amylovoran biosynthesis protein
VRDRIFVSFYDRANLGDDLLLRTLIDRYPGVDFDYLELGAGKGAVALAPHVHGWSVVRYIDGMLRRLRVPFRLAPGARRWLILRSRFAIRIGGSLYMERGAWRLDAERDADLLRGREGAFFINGNFGPWQTPEFLERYARIFSRAVDVTVRDRASLTQLAAVPTVRLAPDLIFSTPRPVVAGERNGVVISVIDLSGREALAEQRKSYEVALAGLVDELVTAGEKVTLMSFCAYEGDEAAAGRVLDLLPAPVRPLVGTHFYTGDVDAALATLGGARAVLATRFHAMVLGLTFGCRVCTITYSDKTAQALDDLGLEGHGWTLEEFAATPRSDVLDRLSGQGTDLPPDVVAAAAGHFDILDTLLATKKEPT